MSLLELSAVSGNSVTTCQRIKKRGNLKLSTIVDLAWALGHRVVVTLEPLEPVI